MDCNVLAYAPAIIIDGIVVVVVVVFVIVASSTWLAVRVAIEQSAYEADYKEFTEQRLRQLQMHLEEFAGRNGGFDTSVR